MDSDVPFAELASPPAAEQANVIVQADGKVTLNWSYGKVIDRATAKSYAELVQKLNDEADAPFVDALYREMVEFYNKEFVNALVKKALKFEVFFKPAATYEAHIITKALDRFRKDIRGNNHSCLYEDRLGSVHLTIQSF
jgi:hypothetical protein